MPIHKTFFPEAPSKKKSVNETVTIPQPVSEPPILIKSNYTPKKKVETKINNVDPVSFQSKPTIVAPPVKISSKKNIFFNLY